MSHPIDPRHGAAFLAVADSGSFEEAAARLHLTASAVSQRVRALETQLGAPLVVRTRPCRATPAGTKLMHYLRRAQLLHDDLMHDLGGKENDALTLAIAINADTLATWLLPVLAAFTRRERVLFDLTVDDQDHTYALLASGQVLASVGSESQAMRGCVAEPLGAMRYRMVASPDFVRRWLPQGLNREAAGRAPVLVYNRKDALQSDFLRARFGLAGGYPCHFVPGSNAFLEAIELGLGYGMVPDLQSHAALRAGRIVDLAPNHAVDVALYWHRWKVQSPVFERLSVALVHAARQALEPLGAADA
ncbi:HTH-type transcriptional regulator ArgP [Chitinibacteraceae bacterium HSL-7]